MLFELDSNNLNSKNLQILGVTSFISHRSKIKIWRFLKMLWYFISRAKQIKQKAEKERKRKRLKATYLAHLAQQRRPSPKGQVVFSIRPGRQAAHRRPWHG